MSATARPLPPDRADDQKITVPLLAATAVAILLVVAGRGFVLMVLWRWFINPELSDVELGWLPACGLVLAGRAVVASTATDGNVELLTPSQIIRGAVTGVMIVAMSLPVGALVGVLA